jgi:DNA polymerase III alpha subunit (gram-positive type)
MWKEGSFLCLDTETTGLGDEARLCSVACVEFRRGRFIEQWSSLCNPGPGVDWEDPHVVEALEVNMLRPQDLFNAPEYRYVVRRVAEYADRCPVWAGHNIGFDLRMLRLGCHIRRQPDVIVDTILVDTMLNPRAESRSLKSVVARQNVEPGAEHTAVGDAMTVGRVMQSFWDELPDSITDLQAMMSMGYTRRSIELANRGRTTHKVEKPMLDQVDWYGPVIRRSERPWSSDSE